MAEKSNTDENEINIDVIRGKISKTSQQDIKLLLVEAEVGQPLVGCTWPKINFFCSVEHYSKWRESNNYTEGNLLSLKDAVKLGKHFWRDFI